MERVKVKIAGISPLLMNRFGEDAEAQVQSGTRSSIRVRKDPRQDAEGRAYRVPTSNGKPGELYIPGVALFSCIIEAGKFHKVGRNKVTTTKTSLVPAGVAISEIELLLGTNEFEVDSRPVTIPATGGKIMRHRPRLDNWSVGCTLEVDTEVFTVDFVRQLVDDAGKKIGLLDFRPQRKGPFGRFVVDHWEVL